MRLATAQRLSVYCSTVLLALAASLASARATNVPLSDLPAACQAAKSAFHPIGEADVQQAKAELIDALDRLDQRLNQAGPNGDDWRKYILWDELQAELQRDKPNSATLRAIEDRYRPDHDGLELVWFVDVQHSLHVYIAMLNVNNEALRHEFDGRLDRLAKSLEAYETKPTTEDALVISETVRFLESARQAPRLVEAIANELVRPNVFAELSPELVGAGIAEHVDDTMPVEDCILGTMIHGTARTIGETHTVLASNPNVGVLETLFCGTTHSNNVGYHGRITIFSNATVSLSARKQLCIDANGLSARPAVSCADVSTDICDIQSCKGRRMIERMAWKKTYKLKPQAEWIAARHAEERLNERIDARAEESIEKANEKYVEKFRRPFSERKLFPQELRFSTTSDAFKVTGLQAGGGKVAAPSAPPASTAQGADMVLRLHESMVNNLAFDALAGRTIYEEKVQAMAVNLLGRLPDKMKGDDDGKPWAITFAPRQPISVSFLDNGFRVTIRGAKYFKGEEGYPAMNVSANYKIEKSPAGQFRVVRQGGLDVFPPGFVPGGRKRLSGPQQVLRKLLEKRFTKVFEPEFLGQGLQLPGKWKSYGKLFPVEVISRDGWLVIAWKRPAPSPKVVAAK
ncbi:MAG: hypothetical protein ABFC96_14955 [Thermoguttaceae bacterium]